MQNNQRPATEIAVFPLLDNALRFQAALAILREAHDYASQMQRPVWDFAVEIQVLRAAGLTNSDLRWLVCNGVVEHGSEMACQCQDRRAFRPTGNLTFTKQTCFVLAKDIGTASCPDAKTSVPADPALQHPIGMDGAPPVPEWDKERQELRVGHLVVKHFKVPAPNQELILASFQEEGWPPRIDDPLPPVPDQDAKRRLHDTITTLNRHQKHRLIRLSGDGSGEGVRWDPLFATPDRNGSS